MKTKGLIRLLILSIALMIQNHSNAQLANEIELTEDNQLLGLGVQHNFQSKILAEERPVIISTPVGYEETNVNYPVLYLLDGLQNIKHIVATSEFLAETGLIPPMIIVGIKSTDRAKDFTPSKAGENTYGASEGAGIPQSGGAPEFLKFLERELIPFIDKNYRTHPYRILEGHSFGGLFSTFTLMQQPELFDAYIIQAPALWWNKEEMTAQAESFYSANPILDKTAYFGIGGNDGWGMRQELIRYVEVIKSDTPKEFRWKHEEVGDEDHDQARLLLNYNGLRFIYSDLEMDKMTAENFDQEEFLKEEKKLMNRYGPMTRRPAMEYVTLYSALLEQDRTIEAISVLKRASEAYPNYVGILSNLARQYEKVHQIENAIQTYQSAIKISEKYKLGYADGYLNEIDRLREIK